VNFQNKYTIALAQFRCQNLKFSVDKFKGTLQRSEIISMFSVYNGICVIVDEYQLTSIYPLYQHLRFTFFQGILHVNSLMNFVT